MSGKYGSQSVPISGSAKTEGDSCEIGTKVSKSKKQGPDVSMPCWYYEKKDLRNTPSFQMGVDPDVEARYRREGARFIINTGTKMGLRYDTMATGVVYFHRFYMFHTFKDFPRYVTACCCLFLAGKVEETPKKCKDIIKTARSFLTDHQFSQFGEDPKEEVMTLERILLQTIKFDLQVDHPYGYLLKYAKCLKGDKPKLQKMVQMAWTFVNDSLCTSLCLQWEPEIIAIALMYLAGKLSKFEVNDWGGRLPKHTRWWDMYVEDISMELLEDICHQVLDLYSNHPVGTRSISPPVTPPTQNASRIPTAVSAAPAQPPLPPAASLPTPPIIISRSNSPSQPPPPVTPTLPPKPPKPELIGQNIPKLPAVVEHQSAHALVKPHPPPQTIPVVTETTISHVHAAPAVQSASYYPPPAETYAQYSSPIPPPPTYQQQQPPPPPPNYAASYTPVEPASYDTSAVPAVPYTQQPQSQHYPASYDAQAYGNYPAAAQQYYPPPQAGYHAQPGQAAGYAQSVTQYEETYAATLPPQYAATAPAVSVYPPAAPHAGYPQNTAYPATPGYPNAPRPGPPQSVQKHGPAVAAGNIAPVRITGRNNRQSWNM